MQYIIKVAIGAYNRKYNKGNSCAYPAQELVPFHWHKLCS